MTTLNTIMPITVQALVNKSHIVEVDWIFYDRFTADQDDLRGIYAENIGMVLWESADDIPLAFTKEEMDKAEIKGHKAKIKDTHGTVRQVSFFTLKPLADPNNP